MGEPKKRLAVVRAGKQGSPPPNLLAPCQKVFAPAHTFAALVALVRDAERRLIADGHTEVFERVSMLRGLYYGTKWSTDYKEEKSDARNLGFDVFAGVSPADPRHLLPCNLYQALQGSQDMRDGERHFDFGHLIIGLDARAAFRTRSLPLPMMGGTGLEVSTWLGDLGGGAAMLAFARADNPRVRALTRFRGSDYGGSINLEGDVAGFVVGASVEREPSAPRYPSDSVADALAAYVAAPAWNERAKKFLAMYEYTGPSDKEALIEQFAGQIESFAVWYLLQRLASKGKFSPSKVRAAAAHVTGAAHECAELFVGALEGSRSSGKRIEAQGPGPDPTPAGEAIFTLEAAAMAAELLE